jgi:hypothetical protein
MSVDWEICRQLLRLLGIQKHGDAQGWGRHTSLFICIFHSSQTTHKGRVFDIAMLG